VVAALSNHDPQDYSGTRHQARGTRFSSPALPRGASFQPPPTPRGGTFQPPFPSGSGFQPDRAHQQTDALMPAPKTARACHSPGIPDNSSIGTTPSLVPPFLNRKPRLPDCLAFFCGKNLCLVFSHIAHFCDCSHECDGSSRNEITL
jgi:hypothetical protein